MGWKAIRDHYRIEHMVHVRGGNVLIGSPYVTDLITIHPDGQRTFRMGKGGNDHLDRYEREMDADIDTLRRLFAEPDVFTASIAVYTYDEARIVEKQCEELGWPHATHDGELMYENSFSPERSVAIQWAIDNARASCRWRASNVSEREEALAKARINLGEAEHIAAKLEAEFPNEWHAWRPSPEEATND